MENEKILNIGKKGLFDVYSIEALIEIKALILKKKRWKAIFDIATIIPRSFYKYNIQLNLDEKPYTDRIEEIKKGMNQTLFKEEKISKKKTNDQINEIENELEKMRIECFSIEFSAIVEEIKYRDGNTILACRIPDNVIEPINKQKYRMDAYKISLIPLQDKDN